MTCIAKLKVHHPGLKKNAIGLTRRDYEGTITTLSGQVHTGRIIPEGDYRSEKVRLSLDPLDASKVVEIDKKEIDQHNASPVSPMPSGLLDTLTLDEVRDLLAYLESGGAGGR